jgi:hypothetical protein
MKLFNENLFRYVDDGQGSLETIVRRANGRLLLPPAGKQDPQVPQERAKQSDARKQDPPRRTQYAPAKHDPPTPHRTPNAPKKTQPEARRQPPQATHDPPTPRNTSPAATAEPAVRRSNATKKATPSFTAQYYTVERAQRVLAEKIEDDPYFSGIDWEHMSEHQLIKCKEFYAARRSRLIRFMDNSPATRQLQREFTTAIAESSIKLSTFKLTLEAGDDFNGFKF